MYYDIGAFDMIYDEFKEMVLIVIVEEEKANYLIIKVFKANIILEFT